MMSFVERDLLLCAALRQDDEAATAWTRWETEFGLDDADGAAIALVPQIYRNLMAQGVAPESLNSLKGIYRHQWAKSQRQLPALAEAFRAMHRASVTCVMLGGLAMRMIYYPEPGFRPFTDADIWIPCDLGSTARQTLQNLGWQPLARSPLRRLKDRLRRRFYQTWTHPNGQKLHLHRHIAPQRPVAALDRTLASDATPVCLLEAPVLVLSPASMLRSLLSHERQLPPISMADATWVIRTAGAPLEGSVVDDIARRHSPIRKHLRALAVANAAS